MPSDTVTNILNEAVDTRGKETVQVHSVTVFDDKAAESVETNYRVKVNWTSLSLFTPSYLLQFLLHCLRRLANSVQRRSLAFHSGIPSPIAKG